MATRAIPLVPQRGRQHSQPQHQRPRTSGALARWPGQAASTTSTATGPGKPQIETRQRLAKYNEWLPQVHVDVHKQGLQQIPYYFAPAAQPYHRYLTQWQRDFQVQIGKNNAKYFDQEGWLYFTKEVFDLLYPSLWRYLPDVQRGHRHDL